MSTQTQAAIENKARSETHPVFDAQHPQEWLLDLGGRKALYHPEMKQWLWFDALHEEWVLAGCGADEAILMSYGRAGGIKKLPQPGAVEDWCVYYDQESMRAPVRAGEIYRALETGKVPSTAILWSANATEWLTVTRGGDQKFILINEAGVPKLVLDAHGFKPVVME